MRKIFFSGTLRNVTLLVILLLCLVSLGTAGYMILEGFSFIDGLYMTVITLSTVGFGETHPLSSSGRLFTIGLILVGAGFVAYHLSYFSQLLLDGNLMEMYRRRRLNRTLERVSQHYIICGYGQMGQIIQEELSRSGVPLVIIEKDATNAQKLQEKGLPFLLADATEEDNLLAAGASRAQGLISVVARDADNVFIVLTSRDLNKELQILARASTPGAEKRLLKAGANRVVSPYASGATRIVQNILRPTVTDFLELALSGEGMELSMEEISIPKDAELVGKDLMGSGIRSRYNLIIVAIKRGTGEMVYNPSPIELLREDDTLIAIGPQENLARFTRDTLGCDNPSLRFCRK
ncbi:MAG: TrkA family potassium uptake protein [Syntrophobacteraceae bacterium]